MVNVIFPIIEDTKENKNFFDLLKKQKKVYIVAGVTQSLQKKYKITDGKLGVVKVYENDSKKEEVINSLKKHLKKGSILIIRKPITKEELDKFVESNADITICAEKKRNSFKTFFNNIKKKMIKFLFGFLPYSDKLNAIMFNDNPSEVLQNALNISFFTRVDRWKGYSYASVDVSGESVKLDYKKSSLWTMLCIWIGLLALAIAGTVLYFCFLQPTFLGVFIIMAVLIILIIAVLIAVTMSLLKWSVGDRYFKMAKEIEKEKKNEKNR